MHIPKDIYKKINLYRRDFAKADYMQKLRRWKKWCLRASRAQLVTQLSKYRNNPPRAAYIRWVFNRRGMIIPRILPRYVRPTGMVRNRYQ